jgi:hypothetical protein
MSLDVDWNPSPRDLRGFAAMLVAGLSVAGGVAAWHASGWQAAAAACGAIGLVVLAAAWPRAIQPVYVAWMALAAALGWLSTHLLLAIIYYGLITPLGCIARLCRHDPLQRRFDSRVSSYWVRRPRERTPQSYFQQF